MSTDAAVGDSSLARQVYDAKDPYTSFPPDNIRFRSRDWFDDPHRINQGAIYLERFMNCGITPDELRSGKPIIGIAQTGSDLVPCNRHHLQLASRVRERRYPRRWRHPYEVPGPAVLRELPQADRD